MKWVANTEDLLLPSLLLFKFDGTEFQLLAEEGIRAKAEKLSYSNRIALLKWLKQTRSRLSGLFPQLYFNCNSKQSHSHHEFPINKKQQ